MTTEIDQKIQEINQKIQNNNGAAVSSDGRLHSSPSDHQKIGTSDAGKSSRGGSTKGRGKYRDTENRNRRHEIQDKSIPISENQEQINSETIMKRHQESRDTYDKSIPISF